jgi:hypothetical protein
LEQKALSQFSFFEVVHRETQVPNQPLQEPDSATLKGLFDCAVAAKVIVAKKAAVRRKAIVFMASICLSN